VFAHPLRHGQCMEFLSAQSDETVFCSEQEVVVSRSSGLMRILADVRAIPWSVWGPQNCRFLDCPDFHLELGGSLFIQTLPKHSLTANTRYATPSTAHGAPHLNSLHCLLRYINKKLSLSPGILRRALHGSVKWHDP
jgi:hypothetical protein